MSFEESVYVNQTATNVSSSFVQPDGGEVVTSGIGKKILLSLLIPSVVILFIIACAYFLFRRKNKKFISNVFTLKNNNDVTESRFDSNFITSPCMLREHIGKVSYDELISVFNVFLLHIRKHPGSVMNIGYIYVEHRLEDEFENMNSSEQLKLFIVLYKHWRLKGFMTHRVEKIMNKLKNILQRNPENMAIFEDLQNQRIENITVLQFMKIDLHEKLDINEILRTIQSTESIEFNGNEGIQSCMDFDILKGHINEELFLDEYHNDTGELIKFPESKNVSRDEICKIHEAMWKKQKEITRIIDKLNLNNDLMVKIGEYHNASAMNSSDYKPSLELSRIMYWGNYCYYLVEMFKNEIIPLDTTEQFSMLYFATKNCVLNLQYGVYVYMQQFESVLAMGRGYHLYKSQHSEFDGNESTPGILQFPVEYQIMAAYAQTFRPNGVLCKNKGKLKELLARGHITVNFDKLTRIAIQLEEDPSKVMSFYKNELELNPTAQMQENLTEFSDDADQQQINKNNALNNLG